MLFCADEREMGSYTYMIFIFIFKSDWRLTSTDIVQKFYGICVGGV